MLFPNINIPLSVLLTHLFSFFSAYCPYPPFLFPCIPNMPKNKPNSHPPNVTKTLLFSLPLSLIHPASPPPAPKLQGRPRKKRKKPTDSESESSEASEDTRPRLKGKPGLTAKPNGLRVLDRKGSSRPNHLAAPTNPNPTPPPPAQVKNDFSTPALNRLFEVDFMSKLHKFMKERNSPITRLPHIGYKQCK